VIMDDGGVPRSVLGQDNVAGGSEDRSGRTQVCTEYQSL
jgi:hypothetical protein